MSNEYVVMPKEDYVSTCDKIREKTDKTELIKSGDLAGQVNKVYSEGYERGLVDGTKEEQEKSIKITENGTTEILPDENKLLSKVTVEVKIVNSFMSNYQRNGERVDYASAFYGEGWTIETFKPEHNMTPTTATSMFENSCISADLGEILEECNVVLDFSKIKSFYRTFLQSWFTAVPTIDCSSATSMTNTFFAMPNLHTIEKIIVHRGLTSYYGVFDFTGNLTNLTIEGEISASISFSTNEKLSMASVDSIGACCIDLTGQDSKTVTFHKNVIAKMSDEQKAVFINKNWTIASKG